MYRVSRTRARRLATRLRENPTPHERLLWRHLRGSQLGGFYFRQQYPIGAYIVDFYCPTVRLAIEVDGGGHWSIAGRDLLRDNTLAKSGVGVLRFSNALVENSISQVTEKIAEVCKNRLLLTNPQALQQQGTYKLSKSNTSEELSEFEENVDNLSRVMQLSILQCEKLLEIRRKPVTPPPRCSAAVYSEVGVAQNMVRWLATIRIPAAVVEKCLICGLIHVAEGEIETKT